MARSEQVAVSLNLASLAIDAPEALKPATPKGGVGQTENFLEAIDVRDLDFEDWLTLERQSWYRRIEEPGFTHDLAPKAQSADHKAGSETVPRPMTQG